jgi:hypothetical protein
MARCVMIAIAHGSRATAVSPGAATSSPLCPQPTSALFGRIWMVARIVIAVRGPRGVFSIPPNGTSTNRLGCVARLVRGHRHGYCVSGRITVSNHRIMPPRMLGLLLHARW